MHVPAADELTQADESEQVHLRPRSQEGAFLGVTCPQCELPVTVEAQAMCASWSNPTKCFFAPGAGGPVHGQR